MELPPEPATVVYTNWKGSTRERKLLPLKVWYGNTPWHPEPQWLLQAEDLDTGGVKDFSLRDMRWP